MWIWVYPIIFYVSTECFKRKDTQKNKIKQNSDSCYLVFLIIFKKLEKIHLLGVFT